MLPETTKFHAGLNKFISNNIMPCVAKKLKKGKT